MVLEANSAAARPEHRRMVWSE